MMYLHEFGLEILVNGQPLPAYNLPISESNLKNANVSYVMDSLTQTKKYSDFTTYVPVIAPGERYTVRFEAKEATASNIIISRVYVDGQTDNVQNLHHKPSRVRSFFCNQERTQIHYFKFSKTSHLDKKSDTANDLYLVNKNQQQQTKYGNPGSITVCFFKGVIVGRDLLQKKAGFEVKQVKVQETADNSNMEIDYTTGFDTMRAKIHPSTVTRIVDLDPIAVLHLHYRSVDWFSSKKISLHVSLHDQDVIGVNGDETINKAENDSQTKLIESNNIEQNQDEGEIIIFQQNNLKRSFDEIDIDIFDEEEYSGSALKKICVE